MNTLNKECESRTINVPKDYLRAPIFASRKQRNGRAIKIENCGRIYEIGGFSVIPGTNLISSALDVRHARVLFTLLTFYQGLANTGKTKIHFSLNQFCKRYFRSYGSYYAKEIKIVLVDLVNCWFRVTYPNNEERTYRILNSVTIVSKVNRNGIFQQKELWLDAVELHPEFCKLLNDYVELAPIRLDVMASIKSYLAQSIYTYMPSRVITRKEEDAFSINLTKLLEEVGHNVPKHKSLRKQLFTQNKNSIIHQLNGLAFSGGILKDKLLFWNGCPKEKTNEKQIQKNLKPRFPKLRNFWLESGRSELEFNERVNQQPCELGSYQEELLRKANILIEGNEKFLKVAFALLKETKFNELASEIKSMVLEPNISLKNPTKVFISQVCKQLAMPTCSHSTV
jgi:hypothetical protein